MAYNTDSRVEKTLKTAKVIGTHGEIGRLLDYAIKGITQDIQKCESNLRENLSLRDKATRFIEQKKAQEAIDFIQAFLPRLKERKELMKQQYENVTGSKHTGV